MMKIVFMRVLICSLLLMAFMPLIADGKYKEPDKPGCKTEGEKCAVSSNCCRYLDCEYVTKICESRRSFSLCDNLTKLYFQMLLTISVFPTCDKGKTFGARETSALCAINTLLSPLSESSHRCKCDNITLFLNMLFEEILSRCVIPKSSRRNYGRDISPRNGIHLRTVFKEPRGLGGMHVRSKDRTGTSQLRNIYSGSLENTMIRS
uniref:WAP domain-containing protein n=1 Tax=Strigamia maritima TaxID=126957 RepID=T1IK43_STRMM